jgi:UDP-galactopyranose mutase
MEIGKETWMGMHGRSEKDIPNKVGTLVATEGDDSIPDRIMVTYSYDDRYFTAILRKK